MRLNKKLAQCKFVVGVTNDNYEQHARITKYRIGSNTYKITVEEYDSSFGDMTNELDYFEEYICDKKKSQIIWSNLLLKYKELEEVYNADPY